MAAVQQTLTDHKGSFFTDTSGTLHAGFARQLITPDYTVHLSGYGDDETRLSQGIVDDIYLPSATSYDYRSYEADTSMFAKGTAEKAADELVRMLNDVK